MNETLADSGSSLPNEEADTNNGVNRIEDVVQTIKSFERSLNPLEVSKYFLSLL